MRAPLVYTDLALAAIHRNMSGAFRVWTLARAIDQDQGGLGRISSADLFDQAKAAKVKRSTFYGWLAQAKANKWLQEGRSGELYLSGIVNIAKLLKVERLYTRLELPAAKLTGKGWRAFVFAATHNGRPTSRQTLKDITGISQRTQARYDHRAKTKRTKSIYVTDRPASDLQAVKEFSPEATAFVYYDKKTRTAWVAHRRPDIRTPYGKPEILRRRWKVNLKLTSAKIRNYSNFSNTRGNGLQMIFHRDQDQANRAARRNGKNDLKIDAFYPIKRTSEAVIYARI